MNPEVLVEIKSALLEEIILFLEDRVPLGANQAITYRYTLARRLRRVLENEPPLPKPDYAGEV